MGTGLGTYYEIWNLSPDTVGKIVDEASVIFGNRVRDYYGEILLQYCDGVLKNANDVLHHLYVYLNDLFTNYHICIRVSI